jgi:Peptidase family M28
VRFSSRSITALAALANLGLPAVGLAQNGSAGGGADAVTAALIRHHIEVIADDSMMGRDTPSRGLDLTARYVAANFRRLGLKPGGDSGTFLQRYRISPHKIDVAHSSATFRVGGVTATASFAHDARYLSGPRPRHPITGSTLLLAGALDSAFIASTDLAGHVVLFLADVGARSSKTNALFAAIVARHPRAVAVITNRVPAAFAALVASQAGGSPDVDLDADDAPMTFEAHQRALTDVFAMLHLDPDALRASDQPVRQALADLTVTLAVSDVPGSDAFAPNAVGIRPGTDPALRDEYLVFSAHMDHLGTHPSSTKDSVFNGADDDASGTSAVMALAEAFTRLPTRRSIIFLTVSGEEKGLWGSQWFTAHPPVPIDRIVADINLDMIGRNWKDTIAVIGREQSDLGATLARVNAAHPELDMHAIDDIWPQENFYYRSDHYNFARRGVPILFFFNGTHADYHQPSDSPDKIDAEKESRIVKLVYYLGQAVGNADERPKWDERAYRLIVR